MKLGSKIFAIACWTVCAAFLASCHHALVKPNSAAIYYSDSKYINLLPTTAMEGSIDGIQHLDGTFSKSFSQENSNADTSTTAFSGEVWVRANDSILSITLMGSFGVTIAELTYANDSVSFASSVIDVEKMKPEYVLADFQACFYPFEALQKNFDKNGFDFDELRTAGSGEPPPDFERTLTDNGNVILRIVRKANEIDLVNELRHYKYHITLGSD
jgi:hypothetical protein